MFEIGKLLYKAVNQFDDDDYYYYLQHFCLVFIINIKKKKKKDQPINERRLMDQTLVLLSGFDLKPR